MKANSPKKIDLDYLLDEVISLPSLPGTVAAVMTLVNDPKCSLAAVAKAISADPPLAMKTLRLVNTAYYGLRQKITTIEHAVVLLGTKVIKNLTFTATVFDIIKGGHADDFFRHSVCCGLATRSLFENSHVKMVCESSDEAFVFGLLHDIGKIMLEQFMPDEVGQVHQIIKERQIPCYQAEQEILGIDHAQLGARLAEKWKLPEYLSASIAGHHVVSQCTMNGARPLAGFVAIADYICAQCDVCVTKENPVFLDEEAWKYTALTAKDIPGIMDIFFEKLGSLDELMQLAA